MSQLDNGPRTEAGLEILASQRRVIVEVREMAFPHMVGEPIEQGALSKLIRLAEREAEETSEYASLLTRLLEDMAPRYHEAAITEESAAMDELHPAVIWQRCSDPMCRMARSLLGVPDDEEFESIRRDEDVMSRALFKAQLAFDSATDGAET